MLEGLEKLEKIIRGKKILLPMASFVFAAVMQCGMTVQAAEVPQEQLPDTLILHQSVSVSNDMILGNNPITNSVSDNAIPAGSVSDNAALTGSVSDNSSMAPGSGDGADKQPVDDVPDAGKDAEVQNPATDGNAAAGKEENAGNGENAGENAVAQVRETETIVTEAVQTVDGNQLQTLNYKDGILTDWQQIMDALRTLTPGALSNPGTDGSSLVLQLQNVGSIPAGIRDSLISDGSGYTKYLQCNIGNGASLVFSGATDNSGFNGVGNAAVTSVNSEKRGKKSMAVTVRFASHENLGTVASLQVNLPQCAKGTKVSVYAETVSMDADGNVTVGENACIGNTKADENGNVEVLIQSTANYMFVYKAAKE